MPYKSEAQRRYMHAAADRGEIARKVVAEFDRETGKRKLPASLKASKAIAHRLAKKGRC